VPDEELPQPSSPDVESSETDDAAAAGSFAYFSLEGDRFNAPGMPADTAREIGAYREALVEIAKELWKQANPDRRRVPGGFEAAFDLRLTTVTGGSARPQMILNRPARGVSDEEWAEWVPFFERARDVATQDVQEVGQTEAVPDHVTPKVRTALGKVGATLMPTERITLGSPGPQAPRAELTARVREVLRRIDDELPPATRDVALVGVVTEYDSRTRSFDLVRDDNGKTVKCIVEHFDAELAERVRSHMSVDGVTAPDVRVEGQTLEPDDEKIRQVHNVHALEVVWTVTQKVVVHRIRELAKLKPGWLGPGTDAPTPDLAALLEPLAGDITALGIPVSIVPNAAGSLVLEWRANDIEYTAELDAQRRLFMCADNVVTDALDEREVEFDPDLLRRFLAQGVME
jgi:hypothetical protein